MVGRAASARTAFNSTRSAGVARQSLKIVAAATVAAPKSEYAKPDWTTFEFGTSPVTWEPAVPKAGEVFTIWYNCDLTNLDDKKQDIIAFNGGFNGPFMCGGAPRGMAAKPRGIASSPLYSIRINVPIYAKFLEFGFTDGENWDEGYKVQVKQLPENEGRDMKFFNDGLAKEMGYEGACEAAIFPDPAPSMDRCMMPGGVGLIGQSCDLDVVPGCTDPEAPNYDPMATVDDATCELPDPSKVIKE